MIHEFTVENWVNEQGAYRIDIITETDEKLLIQVFKFHVEAYTPISEQDAVIFRAGRTITIGTKIPFDGYLVAK